MKILFVCSGNTCRSPMAEAIFQKISEERKLNAECKSAGLTAFSGSPASDNSVEVMKEIGIDISGFRSTSITALMPSLSEFDLFVPMTYAHANALIQIGIEKEKIYLFNNDVSDPYGGNTEVYRNTRNELMNNLQTLAEFIKNSENNK